MFIKQLSVFLENSKGSLSQFANCLGKNNIDMLAISIADTTDFGMMRIIVNDYGNALKILRDEGYAVTITNVIAMKVSDKPGGLALALELLAKHDIGVEYLYSFVRHIQGGCVIIARVDKPEQAEQMLLENGYTLYDQTNLASL